jgi:hypothetical protein
LRITTNLGSGFITGLFLSEMKDATLSLYDAAGKKLWQNINLNFTVGQSFSIPVTNFPKGIYSLAIRNTSTHETYKIVLQ